MRKKWKSRPYLTTGWLRRQESRHYWNTFWEQFEVSIYSKTQLTNVEKLAYFRHALKDRRARHLVEGLSQMSNNYKESIDSLQRSYTINHIWFTWYTSMPFQCPIFKGGQRYRATSPTWRSHFTQESTQGHEVWAIWIICHLHLRTEIGPNYHVWMAEV